ncbi:hypothetical protein EHR08_07750 [Leptospira bandrabouensis]|uniref:Uncharacterized protein n=1 Tax=Leptospira bandrabouensis TaxID=2484903 RepID=A0A6H3NWK6_9LEPT|nr:hypothetical protein EHR07_14835 [Leptospira bandrabouensis]TGN16148.1 hypothetical protein EHR08_07750 [Leptospira bandrabouensis]
MKLHQFSDGGAVQRHRNVCKIQDNVFLGIVNDRHNSLPERAESLKGKIVVLDFNYSSQGLNLFLIDRKF